MFDAATQERFRASVDASGGDDACWPFRRGLSANGYGLFYAAGGRHRATHVAWSIANKQEFPKDRLACHTCDNPPCCNPKHIWPGTVQENNADSLAKGRSHSLAQRAATQCAQGHEFTVKNTHWDYRGQRRCRACLAANARKHRALKKEMSCG